MYAAHLKIEGIRCYESVTMNFSPRINVFVGANNAGKSTILKSILGYQHYPPFDVQNDLRRPFREERLLTEVTFVGGLVSQEVLGDDKLGILNYVWQGQSIRVRTPDGREHKSITGPVFPQRAPSNAIYPFLSRRKSEGFRETVNVGESLLVGTSLSNLYAKVDHITNPSRPSYEGFAKACDEILGFRITAAASQDGKRAVYAIDNFKEIPLVNMGEGVANIVGLLVDLFVAEGKIFLIEEVENDIHPGALKKLLKLIKMSSALNQFFVSTHSNIVVRHLCSEEDSKLFNVAMQLHNGIPTSTVELVPRESATRRAVLEDLGYEFADVDLHAGWLFLEESSAERFIRDHLIRWFTPKLLGRLRTFSASNVDQVELKFEDFDRLFVFTNLESAYRNRAWVIVDAGAHESQVVARLREKWMKSGWKAENFQQFTRHDFESYYPNVFESDVTHVLSLENKTQRREQKRLLLEQVISWIEEDDSRARAAFEVSAQEVITRLKEIETAITVSH